MLYRKLFKRLLDIMIAFIGILFSLPITVSLAFILMIVNKGNFIFTQKRPGKKGEIFKLIKFKTMNDLRDSKGKLLPDKERLTPIGYLIRSTSMDELPQLINVLKGDMSLVGPRPLLVRYLPLYSELQMRRHEVRPGITGWTQVNGRNSLSWERKFELDVWYVDNVSIALDMKILWLTLVKVFKREGINASDATTMKPFTGNS